MRRALLAVVLAVAYARGARADEVTIADALDVAQPGCVDKDALVTQVSALLSRQSVDARVRVRVTQSEGLDATFVVLRGERTIGERRIRSGHMTCPEFRSAVALAIATAIDAEILAAEKEAEKEGQAAPVTSVAPPVTTTTSAPLAPPETPRGAAEGESSRITQPSRAALSVDGVLAYGLLIDSAAGVQPRLTVKPYPWLGLRAGALFATSASPAQLSSMNHSGAVSQTLVAGTAEICLIQEAASVELRECPGFWLGDFAARGDFKDPHSADRFWYAVAVPFELRVPKNAPLSLVVGFTPVIPLGKWSLYKKGVAPDGTSTDETRDLPPIAIMGTIGVQLRIF